MRTNVVAEIYIRLTSKRAAFGVGDPMASAISR